jgi:hypothetical protein
LVIFGGHNDEVDDFVSSLFELSTCPGLVFHAFSFFLMGSGRFCGYTFANHKGLFKKFLCVFLLLYSDIPVFWFFDFDILLPATNWLYSFVHMLSQSLWFLSFSHSCDLVSEHVLYGRLVCLLNPDAEGILNDGITHSEGDSPECWTRWLGFEE